MPFCGECGAKLEKNELFCTKCGAKVSSAKAAPAGPNSATVRPMMGGSGGLFDQSRQFYVLKEKWFDWGGGDIMDERGNKIGKMHRKVLAIRNTTELQELDGSIAATVNRKIVAIKPTHDIHQGDPEGPLIGRLEKTLLSVFRPKFELKDAGGNIILTAQGKFMGWDFNIYRGQDENALVAEIRKADRWRDVFLGGFMDFSDTYAVKILDPNLDRRTALGFVIAIDNVLHHQKK